MASSAVSHSRRLVATVALAAAWIAVSWASLGDVYSTREAAFIQQALVTGSQTIAPALAGEEHAAATRALMNVAQVAGYAERTLRIAVLALLLAAAAVLGEVLAGRGALAAAIPPFLLLALPQVARSEVVVPEAVVVLPAALALLAAPAGGAAGFSRGVLGLLGCAVCGALGHAPAAVVAMALVASAIAARAALLDRAIAVACAATCSGVAWLLYGAPPSPLALGALDRTFAAAATIPAFGVILALLVRRAGKVVVVIAIGAALAVTAHWQRSAPQRPDPRPTLDGLRTVALPGSALVAWGDARTLVAVYSRFGHPTQTPIVYVPEHCTLDGLAAFCRERGITEPWPYPALPAPPAGLVAPESRRASVPGATPLRID